MQQKIVIKVSMHCRKFRRKALQVAAVAYGVTSVALHGPEKDKLMILGDGVDAACLTEALRKKLCHASVEQVEQVKDPEPSKPDKSPKLPILCCQPPQVEYYRVVPDPTPAPCTIM
ncbi:heavy metal-associated isoprenylated plant protein 47-like [Hibiscus syriacus]|uniref:heavy metal-associated isoprenylated plant protein 47-like n=1 Tax=Hibiscus syriacus TaxID=106335 RepID=UPI001922F8C4|nr:heavy metal-associated isoprenylated plant protein 47-like [Hibiscus syriacus]